MMKKAEIIVSGMHCHSCAMLIEEEFNGKVKKIKVSYENGCAEIEFDPKKITEAQIKRTIIKLGYGVK